MVLIDAKKDRHDLKVGRVNDGSIYKLVVPHHIVIFSFEIHSPSFNRLTTSTASPCCAATINLWSVFVKDDVVDIEAIGVGVDPFAYLILLFPILYYCNNPPITELAKYSKW